MSKVYWKIQTFNSWLDDGTEIEVHYLPGICTPYQIYTKHSGHAIDYHSLPEFDQKSIKNAIYDHKCDEPVFKNEDEYLDYYGVNRHA